MKLSLSFMLETFRNAAGAIPVTLCLAVVPFLVGTPLAFLLALAQLRRVPFWGKFSKLYVSFVRGTPVVVLVLLIYNTLPGELAALFKALGSDFNVYREIPPIAYAYLIFTITAVSSLIEIIRAALASVDKGQLEAAYSVGLNSPQAYVRIIIPQAAVAAVPNLCNLMITLVKNTSLAFMMTVKDVTQTAKLGAALNYKYAEAYIVILIIYILICMILEAIFKRLEMALGRHRMFQSA